MDWSTKTKRGLFALERPLDVAAKCIGATVVQDGKRWHCVGHNDLGILYWNRTGNRGPRAKFYVDRALDRLAGFPAFE